jgi:hypothetical protein
LLEDFPAIHTEGGLPGSDSAGIIDIAFIRERLVDTPSTTDVAEADIEAQTRKVEAAAEADETLRVASPVVRDYQRVQTDSKPGPLSLGYILDEIPLIDVDLGMSNILDTRIIKP